MIALIVVIVILVLLIALFALMFNGLVRLNIEADEAWSDITVQLKRRSDLIPNLVESVKGYAKHEKTIFEDVANVRASVLSAKGPADSAKAENQFQQTMKSLFAVAENYPQLRATENFQQLQQALTDTEDKIQASRRFYNSIVRAFNTRRKTFPTRIFANILGYTQDKEFYDVPETEQASVQEPVAVKF